MINHIQARLFMGLKLAASQLSHTQSSLPTAMAQMSLKVNMTA